jgi:hypothetical protein
MNADGSCPTCGRVLDAVERSGARAGVTTAIDATTAAEEESSRAPWHFWVLVVGTVAYLAWRLVQFIIYLL